MIPLRLRTVFIACLVAIPAFIGSAPACAASDGHAAKGARGLSGRRFETLRALAQSLDERAQHVVDRANGAGGLSSKQERKIRESLAEFAQRAQDLHGRIEGYPDDPWDVAPEVADLTGFGQRLETRIVTAPVLQRLHDEWKAMLDVLDRMRDVLAGRDVREPGSNDGGQSANWSQAAAEKFRGLASDLEETAARARENAEQYRENYSGYKTQFDDIRWLSAQAQELRERLEDEDLTPRDLGPIVDQLRERARHADGTMRRYDVYTEVWDDWTEAIRLLDRMARLVGR